MQCSDSPFDVFASGTALWTSCRGDSSRLCLGGKGLQRSQSAVTKMREKLKLRGARGSWILSMGQHMTYTHIDACSNAHIDAHMLLCCETNLQNRYYILNLGFSTPECSLNTLDLSVFDTQMSNPEALRSE